MDEKQLPSALRRYHLINPKSTADRNSNTQQSEFLPSMSNEPCSTHQKRRRCSITSEQSLTRQFSSSHSEWIFDRPFNMTTRKRTAKDDIIDSTVQHFLPDDEQYTHKRARYEQSNSTELENQPPRSSLKRRSLFFQHQQEQEYGLQSSTWTNPRISNEIPLFFNPILPSATIPPYHRTSSAPNDEHHLPHSYTSYHPSSIFHESPSISATSKTSKSNTRLLSSQSNGSSPLRTTNFLLDNKQPTILRTGNISPAHSDSSRESTSTCSSDEQSHQHHPYHFHQPQPWRTYRERENYEQLLNLAGKLADPNRSNQVDIEQFRSYRYKTATVASTLSSKQTACVICMSHFKNSQHIRVLPCQHEYHSKCIARWFTMNSSCPICRRDSFLSLC